jgi:hypothetical protein
MVSPFFAKEKYLCFQREWQWEDGLSLGGKAGLQELKGGLATDLLKMEELTSAG